jgi:hypothetical protein
MQDWRETLQEENENNGGLCYVAIGEADAAVMSEAFYDQAKVVLGPHKAAVPVYHGTPDIVHGLRMAGQHPRIVRLDASKHSFIPGTVSLVSRIDENGIVGLA